MFAPREPWNRLCDTPDSRSPSRRTLIAPLSCCAEKPSNRPSLEEVLEKVGAIQDMGAKHAGSNAAETPQTVDLLQLFDPVHNTSGTAANGGHGVGGMGSGAGGTSGGQGGGSGAMGSGALPNVSPRRGGEPIQQPRPPPPPPPPPPYYTAIQGLAAGSSVPPAYGDAVAAEGKREAVGEDRARGGSGDVVGGRKVEEMSTVTTPYDVNDARAGAGTVTNRNLVDVASPGGGGAQWWDSKPSAGDGVGGGALRASRAASGGGGAAALGSGAGGVGRNVEGLSVRHQRQALMAPLLRGSSIFTGRDQGFGAVSCTRSTSLSEYDVDLPGVLRAALRGGVLSSNARLLCVCCSGPPPEVADGDVGNSSGGSATLPPAEGQERSVRQGSGHVSVMDLWHRGRTVRYPAVADKAAMSPNQSESVIAVFGRGSLHVFSIPRRLRLQELPVSTELSMWR